MKYISFLMFAIVLIATNVYAQKIVFKDQNLKSALLHRGYDFNRDGEIDVSEIDTVIKLNISKEKIKCLDDLSWFKSLKTLNANDNQVTSLDVFFNNNIIQEIYIGGNLLGKKLTLKGMKNLTMLAASKNDLEEIDFTGTDNIESLYLMGNMFEKVEFKNLLKLDNLDLFGNKKLKLIDISFNRTLVSLYLLQTGLSQLNITNNPLLETLYVEKNVKLMKNTTQSGFKPTPIIKQL